MSEIYQIADALVTKVNGAGLSPAIAAQRIYAPLIELKNIVAGAAPTVRVCPTADDLTVSARDESQEDVTVGVGVYYKLAADIDPTATAANAVLDPLVALCRAIAKVYHQGDMAGDAYWWTTKYAPLYDMERLRKERLFFAVIQFTFKQAG